MKRQVGQLFKNLMYIANDYPGKEPHEVRTMIKNSFRKNQQLTNQDEIKAAIDKGWYIYDQMERLISFAKYRAMRRRYDPSWKESQDKIIQDILSNMK